MSKLGKRQLQLLCALGCPGMSLVVGNPVSASLVKRGLLKSREDGSFAHITPAGLRQLAVELIAGRISQEIRSERVSP